MMGVADMGTMIAEIECNTMSRVTKIMDALNQITTFIYAVKGNLVTTTNPLNHMSAIKKRSL
jgi:hypothetical protein